MLTEQTLTTFLDELSSDSPAPGGGSVAALSGALGAALTAMVCSLTIGKKKYADVEVEMRNILDKAENLRGQFTVLVEKDTQAFNKVMEAYSLPKDTETQKALRSVAIQGTMKEAALIPLEVMKHVIDALALASVVAEKGNANSISDAGVSAIMLHAACEAAALNVSINLASITDKNFVSWKDEEVTSLLKTSKARAEGIIATVRKKIAGM